MKFAELKDRLKKKYTVRIIAGVLVIALAGTGAGYGLTSIKADVNTEASEEAEITTTSLDDSDVDADKLLDGISISEDEVDKEESVYLLSDASGNVNQTIVVGHLNNLKGEASIKDETSLTDIVNVKGDETFEQNGSSVTWQADGNEIYYRGTTTEAAPVSQKVTYFLDGNEISPDELAGKSGKVTIRFDYTNNTSYKETIDGKEYEVCVPFVAATALSLGKGFTNIEVTNGKTETTANGTLVLGYALPGLKDSLKVDEDSLEDVTIPEYFEVTADVENFELSLAMTYVSNAGSVLSADGTSAFDSVDDSINEITDAMDQLMDGGDKLADGAGELAEGANDLADGADKIKDGLTTLKTKLGTYNKGIKSLKTGLNSYLDGASQLNTGLQTLKNGSGSLATGATALDTGADQLATGADTLEKGLQTYTAGVDTINASAPALAKGASDVSTGVATVVDSMQAMPETIKASVNASLDKLNQSGFASIVYASGYSADANKKITVDNVNAVTDFVAKNKTAIVTVTSAALQCDAATAEGVYNQAIAGLYQAQGAASVYASVKTTVDSKSTELDTLKKGAATVSAGVTQVSNGVATLSKNSATLNNGAKSLSDGADQLAAGTQSLVDSIPTLTSGIEQLVTGSNTLVGNNKALKDGMGQISNGTSQIVEGVNKLQSGSVDLSDGAGKLADGAGKLSDGAGELSDGLVKFNEQGIEKLVNAYNGDLKPLADRLQVVMDAANSYGSFTGLADGQKGSVKFIYKLDSIKAAAEE